MVIVVIIDDILVFVNFPIIFFLQRTLMILITCLQTSKGNLYTTLNDNDKWSYVILEKYKDVC